MRIRNVIGTWAVASAVALLVVSCGGKSNAPSGPTPAAPPAASPRVVGPRAPGSTGAGTAVSSSPSIAFPPRNLPFDFRNRLEVLYRDTLRRTASSTFVDIEGDIVWISEYLRYRLSGCTHADSVQKVLTQIRTGVQGPECGASALAQVPPDLGNGLVEFPPRNEPFDFRRNSLEPVYQNELRRTPVSTFVDIEGDIVWITEYFRFFLNGCSHEDSVQKTFQEITAGANPPVCTGGTPSPPPSGGANLGISFSPNPVSPSPNPCGGTSPSWDFTININETAGVGFTVTGYTVDFFDSNGSSVGSQQGSATDFAGLFDACGAGSSQIAANGQACANVCVHLGARSNGFAQFTVRGNDANGNSLSFASARLRLAASGILPTSVTGSFGPARLIRKD